MTDRIKSESDALPDSVSSRSPPNPERYCSRRIGGAILNPTEAPQVDRLFFDGYKPWFSKEELQSGERGLPVDNTGRSIFDYQLFDIVCTSPTPRFKEFALVDWIDPPAGVVSLRWLPQTSYDTFSFNILDFFPIAGEDHYDDVSVRHLNRSGLQWVPNSQLFRGELDRRARMDNLPYRWVDPYWRLISESPRES